MRFVVDRHLGRLAKWLRTLGYDAYYDVQSPDEKLRQECLLEDAVLVTTPGTHVASWNVRRVVIVPKDDERLQLRAVVQQLHLDAGKGLFSRCVLCNVPVETVPRESCQGSVPEKVYALYDHFTKCPSCGRLYWEGSHTRRLRARLASILNADEESRVWGGNDEEEF